MPNKDGSGPDGNGSKTGRQLGNCPDRKPIELNQGQNNQATGKTSLEQGRGFGQGQGRGSNQGRTNGQGRASGQGRGLGRREFNQ